MASGAKMPPNLERSTLSPNSQVERLQTVPQTPSQEAVSGTANSSNPLPNHASISENSDTTTAIQSEKPTAKNPDSDEPPIETPKSAAFWLIIFSLCLLILVAAMDSTIVVTSFPTIVHSIVYDDSNIPADTRSTSSTQYVWIANSFLIASVAVQPVFGQIANIFGRANPLRISVAIFILGAGIAGGANSVAMLIAGRAVQGIGSGGIFVLAELVICDIVSLRERGKYLGSVMSFAGIGVTIGPIIGGELAQKNWRWIFWINLPTAGITLVVMFFVLHLNHKRNATWMAALTRIDWVGSVVFVASICSILLALVMGGTVHPWGSWRVIVPLVLGVLGWVVFHIYEASPLCQEETIPPRIFGNRTSFVSIILGAVASMLLMWACYFIPIFFMGARGTSPLTAGVDMLPFTIISIPASIVSGLFITKSGLYRPTHWAGFALLALSFGLLSLLGPGSSKAAWVLYQILNAIGAGFLLMTLLTSTLAPLAESDVGTATATFSFMRAFGMVWGVTLPAIIFNGQFNKYVGEIDNAAVRALLVDGGAYGYASNGFIGSLGALDRAQVVDVYARALKTVWQVAAAFAAAGFLGVFVEKHIELRKELETEYGLKEKKKVDNAEEVKVVSDIE